MLCSGMVDATRNDVRIMFEIADEPGFETMNESMF